jgi:hypothetical protein
MAKASSYVSAKAKGEGTKYKDALGQMANATPGFFFAKSKGTKMHWVRWQKPPNTLLPPRAKA